MFQTTRINKLDLDSEAVITQISSRLARLGIHVVRSFDLQSACASYPDLVCPYHGNATCDCQTVILLIYDKENIPISVVVHSQKGQTEINLVDSPTHRPNPELVDSIHLALLSDDLYSTFLDELAGDS